MSGGASNFASNSYATVGGGVSNLANGSRATVAGGENNLASGAYGTVPGGASNAAVGDYSFAAGRGAKADHDGAFVWADDTNANFASTGADQFRARASGGVFFYSNSAATVGVRLLPGGNSWSAISDSTQKEHFLPADGERFLGAIAGMRLGSWNYKDQPDAVRHYGPMAQEFFAAFGRDGRGVIGTDTTLASADVDGVLFILVQALERRTAELQAALAEVEALRAAAAATEGRLARLEAALTPAPAAARADR